MESLIGGFETRCGKLIRGSSLVRVKLTSPFLTPCRVDGVLVFRGSLRNSAASDEAHEGRSCEGRFGATRGRPLEGMKTKRAAAPRNCES
jgi:hypothetical protein